MTIKRYEQSLFLSKDKQFLIDQDNIIRSEMKMHNGKPCYHAIGLEWQSYEKIRIETAKKTVCTTWNERFECEKWDEVVICTNWELIRQ